MKFGIVIISPRYNLNGFLSTYETIKTKVGKFPIKYITSYSEDSTSDIENYCEVIRTKTDKDDPYLYLINEIIENGHDEWNTVIIQGTNAHYKAIDKIKKFIESNQDILYAIRPNIDRATGRISKTNCEFCDNKLNYFTIHKENFKRIGPFPYFKTTIDEFDPYVMSKLSWSANAVDFGCKFKGIVGLSTINKNKPCVL